MSHIKLHGIKPRIQYIADGTITEYAFSFVIFSETDVQVYLNDILQVTGTYTVSGIKNTNGGTIAFAKAPENGTIITITRDLSIERTTDFQDGGALRADTLNDEFDYQTACLQQVADSINRSMILPPYATDTDVDLTLPPPSAGKAIVWNSDGTNLENSAVKVNELESVLRTYKETAESASTEATTQAKIASTKATEATTQATIATQKASEASTTLASKANTDMDNLTNTGKHNMCGLNFPSSEYVDLVLGSTGATYTAPANGYVYINKSTGTSGQFLTIKNNTKNYSVQSTVPTQNTQVSATMPVAKGDTFAIYYTVTGTTNTFRFIYAQGDI